MNHSENRFSDNMDKTVNPDFIPRSHGRPIKQLGLVYLFALATIVGLFHYSAYVGGNVIASLIAMLIIVLIAAYTLFRRQQHNDVMMATEFENLLFASAASVGSSFCIFLKRDGTIVYSNDGVKRTFPRSHYRQNHLLDKLLTENNVKQANINQLYSALSRGEKEKIIFTIAATDGEERDFILTLDPLSRPAGYLVLRGRQYQETRKSASKPLLGMQRVSPEKLLQTVTHCPIALYITNKTGVIEFANKELETLAGYNPEQIVSQSLTIQKLILHTIEHATDLPEMALASFTGAARLAHADGTTLPIHIQQHPLLDDNQQVSGYYGVVTHDQ